MKKNVLLLLLAATLCLPASGQLNIASLQDGHDATNAARHLPTYLGDRFQTVAVTVFNPYVSIGSNFATVADAKDIFTSDKITSETIGRTINKLRNGDNNIAGIVDIAILNVAFNTTDRSGHKAFSIGFGANERVEVNTAFNQETLLLAYNGNKQFAGQTVSIAPRFNGLAWTEYYVSAAYSIRPGGGDLVIKPAVRLAYLSGQASVEMSRDNAIDVYTEKDGRYLDFGLNYNINTSLGGDSVKLAGSSFNVNNKSFSGGAGSGFGMDLGLRISPKPGILLNVGLMDIGSIHFTKNVTNIYNHSTYRYEGQELTFAQDQSIDLDSLAGFARPNYSYNDYTVKLPTKLVIAGSVGLNKSEHGNSSYYRDQLTLTYLQGFRNYLSASTTAYVAVGYTRSFGGVFNLGANAGLGGTWGGNVGLLASVKAGPFLFGLNTNNILPLIAQRAGRGTDVGMLLGLAF